MDELKALPMQVDLLVDILPNYLVVVDGSKRTKDDDQRQPPYSPLLRCLDKLAIDSKEIGRAHV